MKSAYYRAPGTPGKISVIHIDDVIVDGQKTKVSYDGRLFCPVCGETVTPSNGTEMTFRGRRGYRGPHFRHKPKDLCAIEDCENRVDRQGNDGRYISQRLRLPLFLRPNDHGEFVLSAGFSTANKEALRRLKNQGFTKVVGTVGKSMTIQVSIDDLLEEMDNGILYSDLEEPVLKSANIALNIKGKNVLSIPLSEGNADWSDSIDSFTDQYGAVFQYSAGNAGEKIQAGSSILSGRPYLIVEKDTAAKSMFIQSYMEKESKKYGFLYERKGYLNFPKKGCRYAVRKVVFPSSREMKSEDYQTLQDNLRTKFGVFLCDTISETRPLWPPATRKGDAYGIQPYKSSSVMLIGDGVDVNTTMYQHKDYDTVEDIGFEPCNGTMIASVPLLARRTPVSFEEIYSGSVASYRRETFKESKHEVIIVGAENEEPILMNHNGHYELANSGNIVLTAPCHYTVYKNGEATECEPGGPVRMTVRTGEHFAVQTNAGLTFDITVKGNIQEEPTGAGRYERYTNRYEKRSERY